MGTGNEPFQEYQAARRKCRFLCGMIATGYIRMKRVPGEGIFSQMPIPEENSNDFPANQAQKATTRLPPAPAIC